MRQPGESIGETSEAERGGRLPEYMNSRYAGCASFNRTGGIVELICTHFYYFVYIKQLEGRKDGIADRTLYYGFNAWLSHRSPV